jgi:hypothetical protein
VSAGAASRAINIIATDAPRNFNHVVVSSSGPMAASFDHLVGKQLHRSGNLQAKRFGSFDVDY